MLVECWANVGDVGLILSQRVLLGRLSTLTIGRQSMADNQPLTSFTPVSRNTILNPPTTENSLFILYVG